MKRMALLAAVLAFVLATAPALAQQGGGEFCALPEGCDLDGDGVAETPSGTPVPPSSPTDEQYGDDEEFCAIPEGCGSVPPATTASATASATAPATGPSASPESVTPEPEAGPSSAPGGVSSPPSESPAGSVASGADRTEGAEAAEDEAQDIADSEPSGSTGATEGADGAGTPAATGLTVLPETGGASPAAVACGVSLVYGGLLARRIAR